ncbi:hypothetical protein HAX54_004850, partial [Datura stramonium]|nr:hypothetical protein [Datura stramonium]
SAGSSCWSRVTRRRREERGGRSGEGDGMKTFRRWNRELFVEVHGGKMERGPVDVRCLRRWSATIFLGDSPVERQRRRGDRGAAGCFGRKRGGDGEGRLAACSPEKTRERRERAAL